MNRKQKAEMKEFYDELDTIEGMETTYTDAVDMPDNVPLIEEFIEASEKDEEEDYSEDEIEAFLENVNFDDSSNNLSFDEMMPKKIVETGIQFQLKENTVTPHFLIIRDLVEKSPSVCTYRDCFYDGAQAIGYKNWKKVPEKKRRIALVSLERHTQKKHKFQDTDIIDKAAIPTSWLSPTL